jgi:hypothetical protein
MGVLIDHHGHRWAIIFPLNHLRPKYGHDLLDICAD